MTYFDAEIAGANDVLDLARNKHGLKLGRQISCSMWYV